MGYFFFGMSLWLVRTLIDLWFTWEGYTCFAYFAADTSFPWRFTTTKESAECFALFAVGGFLMDTTVVKVVVGAIQGVLDRFGGPALPPHGLMEAGFSAFYVGIFSFAAAGLYFRRGWFQWLQRYFGSLPDKPATD
jgi:hypothetical protein